MNRTPQSKRFWRILGPVFGYWGIQFVAQMIVQMVIMILNAPEIIRIMQSVQSGTYTEAVSKLTVRLMEIVMEHQSLISGFVVLCTIPMTAFLFSRDRRIEREAQLPVNKKAPLKQYVWILLFGSAFCLGMNAVAVMSGLAMKDASFIKASESLYSESIAVLLICQGILVPVGEELMFRGVLYRRCREQMGFFGAAFSVALFFAFIHGSVTQLLYTLVLGLFLAYFYEKYGSLKAAVFLHILVNTVSVIITKTGVLVWICSDFMRMGICVVGCAFLGAVAFVEIRKMNEKKAENPFSFSEK